MKQIKEFKDKSESYIGYLEDTREDSNGAIVGVSKQSTLDFWALTEKQLIKQKRSHDIQFKVLSKAEGEKRYKSQFKKAEPKKVEEKK